MEGVLKGSLSYKSNSIILLLEIRSKCNIYSIVLDLQGFSEINWGIWKQLQEERHHFVGRIVLHEVLTDNFVKLCIRLQLTFVTCMYITRLGKLPPTLSEEKTKTKTKTIPPGPIKDCPLKVMSPSFFYFIYKKSFD